MVNGWCYTVDKDRSFSKSVVDSSERQYQNALRLLLTPKLCITYYWHLNSALLWTPALSLTVYRPLHSALHTTDIWTLHFILLIPELCTTSEPCTLSYILLTSNFCITYKWPLNSALLTIDPGILQNFLIFFTKTCKVISFKKKLGNLRESVLFYKGPW